MSNCPKCNKKLKVLYLKQTCPYCGANLMYYDFENRLADDAASAQKEWGKVEDLLSGIKKSAIGSNAAIIRLVLFFLPVAALLLPVFKFDYYNAFSGGNVSLISMIKLLINPAAVDYAPDSAAGTVFGSTTLIFCLAAFASVVVFALLSVVLSLFSFTKNGFKRNMIVTCMGLAVFAALSVAVCITGGGITYGFYAVIALTVLTTALHFSVNKKISNQQ